MKNYIAITFILLIQSIACNASILPKLDAETQKQAIERVKEYCQLMQEVSGNIENIDKIENIYTICENSNVSVFNDLTTSSTRDISANSMPLQQYMMMLTDKFENNIKTSYSGYKYIKYVVQPSPLKEFDAARYAFIKVSKNIESKGIKLKQNLNILVNTTTMKVSSTISEDYEDPQRIYMEALEKFNTGNYNATIPMLKKICDLARFSGRYRAKTMLGWIYAEQKEYEKANKLLRESYQEDPLGSVILASKVLLADDAPAKLINYTEAGQILTEVSDKKDKDIPTMHLIAKAAIADAFDIQKLAFKFYAVNDNLISDLIADPYTSDAFKMRGYFVKAFLCISKNNANLLKNALGNIMLAKKLLESAGLEKKDYEHWDIQISSVHNLLLQKLGDSQGASNVIQYMTQKPYFTGYLGLSLIAVKNFQGALGYLRKAAEYGDATAAYILSLSYLPTHNPLRDYEKDFITQTRNTKDERALPNWKLFVDYLLSQQSQKDKSYEEFLKWNKKAIELGDINAKEDYAYFEATGEIPSLERNIPHALELACTTASIGLRSQADKFASTHNHTLWHEMVNLKIPFEQTQTIKTLKTLDKQGNGTASYLLFIDYLDMANDTVQSLEYLIRSAESKFFWGMHSYAEILLTNEHYEEAEKLYNKLVVYPYAYVCSMLGDIQKDYRHNYKTAKSFYEAGYKNEKDPRCCERLGDLYKDGLGVKKNLGLAITYYRLAIAYYQSLGLENDDEDILAIKEKIKKVEKLKDQQAYMGTVKEMIEKLNSILDENINEDERINLSQSLLSEIFASPQAKVKTMDSTGKTVVSTETAEDFMLRLATMKPYKKIVGMSYKKTNGENFKLTELTVKIK